VRPVVAPLAATAPAPIQPARPAPVDLDDWRTADIGPIHTPKFTGASRRAGQVLLAILVIAVVGAILATILSYQLNV
jgi:hypothetical protein